MDQMQKGFFSFQPAEAFQPSVNLYETDTSYLVCVDLAGVIKDEIDLSVVGCCLTLRGTRVAPIRQEPADAGQKYRVHLMEIDHGAFVREVELPPDVLQDRISATYRNGMLWVEVPKQPPPREPAP
jgi:HSP20 family protein